MKIKLAVVFGGETVEHEVSIISAIQAINNINREKYEVIPIYISKDRIWYCGDILEDIKTYKNFNENKKYLKEVTLCKKNNEYVLQTTNTLFRKELTTVDVAFPIVHGNNVEDGSLAGYFDTIGLPYVSSRVLGSALGQDKIVMKQVMASCDIPIVDYTWFYDTEFFDDKEKILKNIKKIGYPVIVKPATLGSSVGITFVKSDKEIESAIEDAISYDTKVVVEQAINNLVEVNASVLGNYFNCKVSPLEEVMGEDDILSFQDKYLSNSKTKGSASKGMASTSRIIPARISDKLTKDIQDMAIKTFKVLNLSGVCRIDFLIDSKTKKFYVNEPNTIPGSLSFYLWKEAGIDYKTQLDEMIQSCIKEYKNRSKKVKSFESNILDGFSGSKGTKGGLKG